MSVTGALAAIDMQDLAGDEGRRVASGSPPRRFPASRSTGASLKPGRDLIVVDSYAGPRDITPSLPVVQEVEQLGDFEAVLSWGAGLSQASCIRTLELSTPTRLVIDVQTP